MIDLCITSDKELRKIFYKGSKLWDTKCTGFVTVKTSIVESIDDSINTRYIKTRICKISL